MFLDDLANGLLLQHVKDQVRCNSTSFFSVQTKGDQALFNHFNRFARKSNRKLFGIGGHNVRSSKQCDCNEIPLLYILI